MAQEDSKVSNTGQGYVQGAVGFASMNAYGARLMIDFWSQIALDGYVFQVRAGTITTPLIGGAPLADTAAEFCVDNAASTGLTLIPTELNISVRLGTGTLHEYALKSKPGANSTSGAAFIPLPLMPNAKAGSAAAPVAAMTARVAATAATVTVPAETVTTTMRHWAFSQPIAMGAYVGPPTWNPRSIIPLKGQNCLWAQVSATTTGPSYYAHLNYAEIPSALLGI